MQINLHYKNLEYTSIYCENGGNQKDWITGIKHNADNLYNYNTTRLYDSDNSYWYASLDVLCIDTYHVWENFGGRKNWRIVNHLHIYHTHIETHHSDCVHDESGMQQNKWWFSRWFKHNSTPVPGQKIARLSTHVNFVNCCFVWIKETQ